MKKYFFLFLYFTFSTFLLPKTEVKNNSFSIRINNKSIEYSKELKNNTSIIDFYNFTNPSKAGEIKLPQKIIYVAIPFSTKPEIQYVSINTRQFENSIPATQPEILLKNDSTFSYREMNTSSNTNNKFGARIIDYTWLNDFYCAVVEVNSYQFLSESNIIKYDEEYELKFSFDSKISFKEYAPIIEKSKGNNALYKIIENYDIAEQFRNVNHKFQTNSSDSWINFQADYLKLSVINDGIYRLNKQFFLDNGIDIGTDPTTFQLFNYGEELPIFVSGESDFVFNDNDYIEFYGSKNYSKISARILNDDDSEYNEFMNRFSDTTHYFLTWGTAKGKRISTENISSPGVFDTINYYQSFSHFEQNSWYQNLNSDEIANQTPNWFKNKTWYWNWLGNFNSPRTFNFNVNNLVKEKKTKVYFKLVSGGSNLTQGSHIVTMSLNNAVIDSQVVNRFEQVIMLGEINSSNLIEGNNTLKLTLEDNGTNPNFLAYDWYEIEYPKNLSLENDSLTFTIDNLENGLKVLEISNATKENYTILKTFPNLKIIDNYTLENGKIYFVDTVNVGDKYSIISADQVLIPENVIKKKFINLSSSSNSSEYIAITHPKFSSGVNEYISFISQTFNVSTKSILVTDIFDQYGYGYPTPESIKEFLINAYNNWAAPKFSYLVLIGDATYDYKYYIKQNTGVSLSTNYVPSYGNPTGDYWYGIWDESNAAIPQIKIGRLPINESEELEYYMSKIQNNIEQTYSSWNKEYLFFTGGGTESEINQLKSVNQSVIDQNINSSPLFGNYWHFYKTVNPQSDFGPYSSEQFQNAIDEGGVFISYLGHSGTATWDNSINSILQLENKINKNPIITDFGCSTNKFAEPDIICFGERAVLENRGQALGYIGNSSLGFLSTAINAPPLFYNEIISDSLHEIGSAHLKSKIDLITRYGNSSVNKVFAQTNILLGDPIIKIKIPNKPNLNITQSNILINSDLNENIDSSLVKIIINNYGTVNSENLKIKIEEIYSGNIINSKLLEIPFILRTDTLDYHLQTKNNPGIHSIRILIDPDNEINEIYEDDNSVELSINVFSQELKDMFEVVNENSNISSLKFINPSSYSENEFNINVQLSESLDFNDPILLTQKSDTLLTKVPLILVNDKRYWFRYKLDNNSEYGIEKSFYNSKTSKFLTNDEFTYSKQKIVDLTKSNQLFLADDSTTLSVLSAGWNSGATCVIAKNGENLLSNSFFAGMGIAVFNPVTTELDTAFWLTLFNQPANVQSLADFINTIPEGRLVIMGVADDARNNLSTNLKNAIKTLGSTKIDSLVFRGSWAIISHKGAEPGTAIEQVLTPYDGQIFLDSVFVQKKTSGSIITNLIGPSSTWKNLVVQDSLPNNSQITYKPILISQVDNSEDTLSVLNMVNGEASLSFIDAKKYPYIKILAEFEAGDNNTSPVLNSLGVDYAGVPELAINYQVVSVEKDTVQQGEDANLHFYVYNVGESTADSFKVMVEVVKPDNSKEKIFEEIVDSIGSEKRKKFNISYPTANFNGARTFSISIDTEEKVDELFEDNNFYNIPFYVVGDTTRPTMNLTIDGNDIFDGEYISNKPQIKIELSDPSLVPITDTSSISIFLNNRYINYKGNEAAVTANFAAANPKVTVNYNPELENGEYTLRIFGKDASGNISDSSGISKNFVVQSDAKLLNVYNYPNPFTNDTYFTFKLTQIPDEISIKVFTVAGRLIKEIILNGAELNFDLNKIYWDGRDDDGDLIGNGVYLYKVIMDVDGKKQDVTQKLAIVR